MLTLVAVELLALGLAQAELSLEAGLRTETSAGVVPTGIYTPSETVLDVEAAPMLGLRLDVSSGRLVARYRPRFVQRIPDVVGRPVVLHRAHLLHEQEIAKGWRWFGEAELATGELLFGAALREGATPDLTDPTAPDATIPNAAVLETLRVSGNGRLSTRIQPRWRLSVFSGGSYRAPGGDNRDLFPSNSDISLGVTSAHDLSRDHRVDATVAAGWVDFSNGDSFRTLAVSVGSEHDLTRVLVASARLGTTFLRSGTESRLLPEMSLGLRTEGAGWRRARVDSGVLFSLRGAPNPVLATFEPRAHVLAFVETRFRPHWSARLTGVFYTTATGAPRSAELAQVEETVVSADLPIAYMPDDQWRFEIGARLSARGPHLATEDFELGQWFVVGYVAVAVTFDTRGS